MKNFNRDSLRLYAVTDRSWLEKQTLYEQVEEALRGGATMVQIREKELDEADFEDEAREIQKLCRKYQVPMIINDNVALAKRVDADGVHIGEDKIIGVTAKTIAQAKAAEAAGADYLGSGAVFGSSTKLDAKPMEHALFQEICESVAIPVVAIGGITADNVMQLKGRGMAGVAVVSGIFACKDIEAGTRRLRELVDSCM